ncbi:hypothetical protein A0H81_00345 [Grifola frondosa]|uniref:Uncharacterized protein n=1 Tax=Grifola frondosa TaxID=5627 RepID=A0A1C7MQ90_GRIFR|nr:hypothetical protein A0H81_05481 [Grifola frondosa]OBZ76881.1 hypothetical protein A0H81_03031 [Grifola frondosa]OBZ78566.1 hypothetical protein A0H81_01026 [Grifola frondosa]OBZ78867.1 hypothetical protein A0H81_00345 [Grifola frondosa]
MHKFLDSPRSTTRCEIRRLTGVHVPTLLGVHRPYTVFHFSWRPPQSETYTCFTVVGNTPPQHDRPKGSPVAKSHKFIRAVKKSRLLRVWKVADAVSPGPAYGGAQRNPSSR